MYKKLCVLSLGALVFALPTTQAYGQISSILSAAGDAGYKNALSRHYTNMILDTMNRCSIMVQEKLAFEERVASTTCGQLTLGNKADPSYDTDLTEIVPDLKIIIPDATNKDTSFTLTTDKAVSDEICQNINAKKSILDIKYTCVDGIVTAEYQL